MYGNERTPHKLINSEHKYSSSSSVLKPSEYKFPDLPNMVNRTGLKHSYINGIFSSCKTIQCNTSTTVPPPKRLKLVYQACPCNNKLIGTICTQIHLNKNPIQFNKIVLVKNQTVDL